jgi:hypothetical protein
MAEPAQRLPPDERRAAPGDSPPVDPWAIQRAYRFYRAKRRARQARLEESRRARIRFLLVMCVLTALSIFIALTIWHQIQNLFGL